MSSADRSRDRRPGPAWLPLAAAALVVPTALAGLTLLWPRPQIEGDLTRTASESLAAAGITGAGVAFSGRDAVVSGLTGPDAARAVEIVQGVPGVRIAQLPADGAGTGDGTGDGTGAEPDAAASGPFGIARRGGDIVLTGVVGSEAERAALVAAATEQAGGSPVVDELTVTEGALPQPGVTTSSVGAIAALLSTVPGDIATSVDGDTVTLTGNAPDSASAQAAGAALSALVPGATVDNRLTVAGGGAAPSGELDDAGKRELQSAIDALVAGAPVTFEPDSPALTASGAATVDGIVTLVALVPGAQLQVDGYVATGPGNGVLSAQELSDQRAAAVRDALVAGGVPADNITARGLGEGDSPAAQAAGRRVEITVV
ncbi:channel-forming protein ArfA/OmpATb [Pseudonocardia abyssalis]|uniref:OmpA family protein n=1 Tax=Pseudonocardia abyssalis TaxID=2792008 RepID=A0ABS6UP26_9PSEU|nr:OmpA family protein [Pseudonocardia abyssalis]MBW0118352.1 OmpA family protein [Pseudonocardia abyssalis]MBW0134005.1 OmpA family protein [Pseudonocardia abyssalis]